MDFSKPYALDTYFGNIDIYLFDQLLKGRIQKGQKILDAGCGGGRNLLFMMRQGFDLYGVDQNPAAISAVKTLATEFASYLSLSNFKNEAVERLSFSNNFFSVVISSAVLHFAQNEAHFDAMLKEMWRVLKPGGILFARLASDIGIEKYVKHLGNRRFQLGDGTERFLINEEMASKYIEDFKGSWIEPLKTLNVANKRAMTTLVWKKNESFDKH